MTGAAGASPGPVPVVVPTSAGRTAARLGVVAAGAALVAVLAYVLGVRTGLGQRVDDWVFEGRKSTWLWSRRSLTAVVRVLTPVAVLLGTAGLAIAAAASRRPRLAGAVVVAVGASAALGSGLKGVLPRPPLAQLLYSSHNNTLPSGHTAVWVALALCAVTVATVPRRRGVALGAGALAVLAANALLASGWHRPSDVVAGAAIAVACTSAALAVLVAWRGIGPAGVIHGPPVHPTPTPTPAPPTSPPSADRPWASVPTRAVVAAGLVVVGVALVVSANRPSDPRYSFATYAVAVLAVDLVVVAAVAAHRMALGDAEVDPPGVTTWRPAAPGPARPGTPGW